ncbi:desulfoferrodoxin FeS4 iron-binding domain-containing protein [bacterium]|nr:desulfoferrodoxin FeS4 iron-binding domain-containing protein [bacterium]
MTEKLELYKCHICGNLVQVILNGAGELVCCGQNMELLIPQHENENAELTEKHTPKLEEENDKRFVRLKYHPMIPEHYIQFIEIYPKDKSRLYLKYLNPNEIAEFDITHFEENIEALEHCNIHGLWRNNND